MFNRSFPSTIMLICTFTQRTQSFLPPTFTGHTSARAVIASSTRQYSKFLEQVERTIDNINPSMENILHLPTAQRESVGVANRLSNRIKSLHKNNDCPTCWLQRAHCVCKQTPPIDHLIPRNVNRLFMVMHHKEIGLVVDTAKVLLNAMPTKARLIVNGIDQEHQESVRELMDALEQKERRCIVLFPTDDAVTFEELCHEKNIITEQKTTHTTGEFMENDEVFDVIVMDGTWSQARKIHARYIPLENDGGPPRVCLSQESLDILGGVSAHANLSESHTVNGVERGGSGRQLRRHPIKWKEVSTLEATRLLLRDMAAITGENLSDKDGKQCHDILAEYQVISDAAAVKQLGPPREKDK